MLTDHPRGSFRYRFTLSSRRVTKYLRQNERHLCVLLKKKNNDNKMKTMVKKV